VINKTEVKTTMNL